MGPTGAGKSAVFPSNPCLPELLLLKVNEQIKFIEALAPDSRLSISKNSLESVTQEVSCYRVVNLGSQYVEHSYVLMDTPGFLDVKLSESRVTRMITSNLDALRENAQEVHVHMFYFQPITDIRMSGSKQNAVKVLRSFALSFDAASIIVVTTMWNMVSSPQQIAAANERLSSLKTGVFANSGVPHIDITKFEFTNKSALAVLDTVWYGWPHHSPRTSAQRGHRHQALVRSNLLARISNTQQRLQFLVEDIRYATTPGNEDSVLLDLILKDEQDALSALKAFLDDLFEIDPHSCSSPLPEVFELLSLKTDRAVALPSSASYGPSRMRFSTLASKVFQKRKK